MRPGTILVFFTTIIVMGALILRCAPLLGSIREVSLPAYYLVGTLCLVLGFGLPLLATMGWDRRGGNSSSQGNRDA